MFVKCVSKKTDEDVTNVMLHKNKRRVDIKTVSFEQQEIKGHITLKKKTV